MCSTVFFAELSCQQHSPRQKVLRAFGFLKHALGFDSEEPLVKITCCLCNNFLILFSIIVLAQAAYTVVHESELPSLEIGA